MNAFTSCKKFILSIYQNSKAPAFLYYAGFLILLGMQTWTATMLPQSLLLKKVAALLLFFLIGIKIVFYDSFLPRELVFLLFGAGTGVISFLESGYIYFLLVFWLAMGGKGMDAGKVMKLTLILVVSITSLSFFGARLGLVEDIIYDLHEEDSLFGIALGFSHSLGSIYTTDAAARIFFLFLLCFYLLRGRTGLFFSILLLTGSFFTYVLTRGRLDSICLFLLSLVSLFDHLAKKSDSHRLHVLREQLWSFLALVSMPFAAAFSVLFCLCDETIQKFTWLDDSLTSRVSLGKAAIDQYGINLFGHEIELVGNGHVSQNESYQFTEAYNYLDVSYIQVLMIYGLIALLLIVGSYMYISWRNRKDTYLMITICFISLNCMVAHHLLDLSYIPFIVFLTAGNRYAAIRETGTPTSGG